MSNVQPYQQNVGKCERRAVVLGVTASSKIQLSPKNSNLICVEGMLVDTGSPITLVPRNMAKEVVSGQCPNLIAANGSKIETYGKAKVSFKILGKTFDQLAVVADIVQPILGLDFFEKDGKNLVIDPFAKCISWKPYPNPKSISTVEISIQSEEKARKILKKFPNITSEHIGLAESLTLPLRIHTKGPPVFSKCRPLFGEKRIQIENELRKWEKEGVIERVCNAVEWASPIHAVKKSDGSWRVCGDFRLLNNITRTDRYPVPSLQSFNENMADCKVFSKIDLRRAYHQVKVHEEDQEKTVINTTIGLFKFKRMPYGLKNSGGNFQRNIHLILKDLPFIFVYMDDLILASKNEEEHLLHLEKLFATLERHNLLINEKKCEFCKSKIKFLGHMVSKDGISIPDDRVDDLQSFPKPTNVKELERFLGLFAFVHRFIKNASGIVAPLHTLRSCSKKEKFQDSWCTAHEEAFNMAKKAIANATLLAHPKLDAKTEIWTDASEAAVGAILVQHQENRWVPLAFWSRAFNAAQKCYAAFNKELLAISYAVTHFKDMLEGQPITIRTDHLPLVGALSKVTDKFTPLQRRHLNNIAQYVEEIHYLEGSLNGVADALSRMDPKKELEDEEDKFEKDLINICHCETRNDRDSLPSPNEFRQSQQNDKSLMSWIAKHQQDPLTPYQPKLVPCADANSEEVWADVSSNVPRILVPTELQETIFKYFHSISHSGSKATYNLIKKTHYWPKMRSDITKWARQCASCQRNKISRHTKSFLEALPQPNKRFSHVHIDIVGPLNGSANSRLFTMIDRWTGWPEAIPILDGKHADAKVCAQILVDSWISRFGVPQILTSDCGKQFTSKIWKEVMEILGIKHILTSTYHPQSNGKVERMHRTLKNSLRSRLDGKADWIKHLPFVLLGLRSAPNTDTGISPSLMVYGQLLDLPGQMVLQKASIADVADVAKELTQVMSKQKFIKCPWHDATRKTYVPKALDNCQMVLVRCDGIQNTLRPKYTGPFKVLSRNNKTFLLDLMHKTQSVSIDRLVPYYYS